MYWVWAAEPAPDGAEAIIHGTAPALDDLSLRLEDGLWAELAADPGPIEIVRGRQFRGALAEHVQVSGLNGLLFGARLREALAAIPVENLQSWPASLVDPVDGTRTEGYHLVNIVGRVACLDRAKSVVHREEGSDATGFIDVLAIDEGRIGGLDLFRLHEDPQFILASDRVKDACERHRISGVAFYRPSEYPY